MLKPVFNAVVSKLVLIFYILELYYICKYPRQLGQNCGRKGMCECRLHEKQHRGCGFKHHTPYSLDCYFKLSVVDSFICLTSDS